MEGGRAHRAARRRHRAALLALACALAGCGGGDGEERVKAWSEPEQISYPNGNVATPEVVVDASGIATAVFRDHDGAAFVVAANRFVPGNSWGSPQTISTAPATAVLAAIDVAAGPSGEVVAVWTQEPALFADDSAWVNGWTPGVGWGMPGAPMDGTLRNVFGTRVALDASGAGTAIWVESAPAPDTDDVLAGKAFPPGLGSATPFTIPLQQPTRIQGQPVIAAQANGRTYVAFSQVVGSGVSLFASWSDDPRPSVWRTELVDTLSPPARNPDLAVNASGTAFLVWDQAVNAGDARQIWARRRLDSDLPNAWEAPLPLSDNVLQGEAKRPRVAVDDAGNAIALWEQEDSRGATVHSIWYSLYLEGAVGWGAAQLLETAGGNAGSPLIAMAPGGEAFAVWLQEEGGNPRVWAARFLRGSGWQAPVRLENDAGKQAVHPALAVDGSGNAFAVWALSDPAASGVSKAWAAQYR